MPTHDESVDIAVNGGRLAGTLVTPRRLMPAVLFVHGWGGSQEQYLARAREVAALGCACLTFDLGGHAATRPTQETVSRESNLHDTLAAYDLLAQHRLVDRSAIAVVGSSYGGYLAAILTSMRAVKWLALRVPALYIDSGWETPKLQLHKDQDLRSYRQQFVPAEENRALRACSKFKGDVLLVESEHDQVIPHAVVSSYHQACIGARSLTYRVMPGADHGLSDESAQHSYTALLVSWLTEMVFGPREANAALPAGKVSGPAVPEAPPEPG